MKKDTQIAARKDDHIRINLEEDVASGLTTGLERYRLVHQALPELALEEVELGQTLFGVQQRVPVLVSSMTGGTERAARINRHLAQAAETLGLALGLGSQRAAIENPALAESFQVRRYAPNILLLANLGAVQLNAGYGVDAYRRAVEMIEADALILHLNPLQEVLQPEGQTDFRGLVDKIAALRVKLGVPIIVKEVGWGLSAAAARLLYEAGVDALDVAGAGGTSWSQVEMHRQSDPYRAQTAAAFVDWGLPTADSLLAVKPVFHDRPVFASGGLRSGVEIVKCLVLGASMGGMAGPFLKAADESLEATVKTMQMIVEQVRIAMFACGARRLADLSPEKLNPTPQEG
ncbi:MAG: type 2 isopentenyl-diphosphate Delta-isomerase [Chloroflexi bacterium]|nr:type 2 isopentenyl-diphosphate Delta-isomerase [Chloroflexota bacterium]